MTMAIQQLYVRLQQFQETLATILQAERDDLASQYQSATSTITQKQPGVVDTRVIGRPDEFVQTESIFPSCEPAVSDAVSDDRSIVNTETRREAPLRGELSQHTDALHTRDDIDRISIGQVSQCRHERGIRGQETVRDGVGNGVCWTPDERVTDKSWQRSKDSCTRVTSETVGDDTKTGVTVLGMEDMRVKAYLIQNRARIASWTQMREEILEVTRTQQYDDSQPVPGVRLREKGKGKASKGKGKGRDCQDKGKSKDKNTKNDPSKKSKRGGKKRCYYLSEDMGMYGIDADRD